MHTNKLRTHIAKGEFGLDSKFSKLQNVDVDPGSSAYSLVKTKTYAPSNGGASGFLALIEDHRACEATDPRDMIYALQGIARVDRVPFPTFADILSPNYHIGPEMLYIGVTRSMLKSMKNLRFIQYNGESPFGRKMSTLPSWVPDFSANNTLDSLRKRIQNSSGVNLFWRASGSLQWSVDKREFHDPLLDVQGVCIGVVEAVAADFLTTEHNDVWRSMCEVVSKLGFVYSTDPNTDISEPSKLQTRMEVFWRTLVADTFNGQTPAPKECGEQFLAHLYSILMLKSSRDYGNKSSAIDKFVGHFHRFMIKNFGRSIKDSWFTPWIQLLDSEPSFSKYGTEALLTKLNAISSQLWGTDANRTFSQNYEAWAQPFSDVRREMNVTMSRRRLFRTNGGLLGLGPLDLQETDEIWVLAGAYAPIVLRPLANGNWRYLGEAYVHGCMRGEALKDQNTNESLENLVLE